jgi:DNA-binding MarR family transcriptional regulator
MGAIASSYGSDIVCLRSIEKTLIVYAIHKKILDKSDLKLDQLRTFTEVIALGSFSAAAERLQLSQPAVSPQVRQPEKGLGVRLIERADKRATPTAAGRELIDRAKWIGAAKSLPRDFESRSTCYGRRGRTKSHSENRHSASRSRISI